MTTQEIRNLRKSGQLDDAYNAAKELLEEEPNNIWNQREMAWILHDYLKSQASIERREEFLSTLIQIQELNLPAEEKLFYSALPWAMRTLIDDMVKHNWENADYMERLIEVFVLLPFCQAEASSSALLNILLKQPLSPFQLKALQHWQYENFQSEDYQKQMYEGRALPALVERWSNRVCKLLEEGKQPDAIRAFLPTQEKIAQKHTDYQYAPFHLAKLYIVLGSYAQAAEVLKPFAQKKANDFWVWDLLSQAQTEDQARLSFLCRALLCPGPETMKVGLFESAALFFAHLQNYDMAKYWADKCLTIRQQNSWKIPASILEMQSASWYKSANPVFDKDYLLEKSEFADSFLFGQMKEDRAMVTYFNQEKHMVSYVLEDKTQGFFKVSPKAKIRMYDVLTLHYRQKNETGFTQVSHYDKVQDKESTSFFKKFSGPVHIVSSGIGFVESIFIPKEMLQGRIDGESLRGIAAISYDKSKNTWGWKAIKI